MPIPEKREADSPPQDHSEPIGAVVPAESNPQTEKSKRMYTLGLLEGTGGLDR